MSDINVCKNTCHLDESGRCFDCGFFSPPLAEIEALNRPPREVYVRSSRPTEGGAVVEPGIEYRDGDDFTTMAGFLNYDMFKADVGTATRDPKEIAEAVEARIKERWPDRAYFVEVHDPRGGWIQIFQPFGVPRNR